MDTLPSLKAVSHLSHLMCLASPYVDEYPYCIDEAMQLGR